MNDRDPRVLLDPSDTFPRRHLGPSADELEAMLAALGYDDLETLMAAAVPAAIRQREPLELDGLPPRPLGEHELLERLRAIAADNRVFRSLIGMGYADCLVPSVIRRNVLENPGWYTPYTPYQAEISQGRLEALLNFQTLVAELTALPVAGASLLDEATAAAEAMTMAHATARGRKNAFVAADDCHPQTLAVLATRAEGMGVELRVGALPEGELAADVCGVLAQYPSTDGRIHDLEGLAGRVHDAGALLVVATDLLALTLLRPPGELGADVAVGNSQRFGVPLGYGGPHAAFLACTEKLKRLLPGRVIGVSKDVHGHPAYRMAMQTREQHIRREKATSNICTAQVLLAVMASLYAVYHGPEGLRRIARRVRLMTRVLAAGLERLGCALPAEPVFDTLRVGLDPARHGGADDVLERARMRRVNLRRLDDETVGITLDERTDREEIETLWAVVDGFRTPPFGVDELAGEIGEAPFPGAHERRSEYLAHPVFQQHRTEHEMLRYLHRLEGRDLSLTTSMIPLGSCTMKLNATTEMLPVSWPAFSALHPFAPVDQAVGYRRLIEQLETWLCQITGFDAFSLQPNSGAQGEYAGLMTIRAYHHDRGERERDVCLIPVSAHGTNPASAVMAGMRVVTVACDEEGNVELGDVRAKAAQHGERLAALMITYPSTHGVFEEAIGEICAAVHAQGGQVYLDGANLNAQVGLCRPADYGADVCHLNLHKTFCIPHGGGGPGMGPIGVKTHLAPFLPGHPVIEMGGERAFGTVSAAPWGSPSILPISWSYIALMGAAGLTRASQVAILAANYMAHRLAGHYPVLYRGPAGRVAHELILDLRPFKKSAGVDAEDVAKRLMDYGFHAPTMSWPVPGTLMIEPTESESKDEIDRYCEALIAIREEIRELEEGRADGADNALKNAPHTAAEIAREDWSHPYSREQAAYPVPWLREHKFWPPVGRVDNAWGDRNFFCTCPPIEAYAEDQETEPAAASVEA